MHLTATGCWCWIQTRTFSDAQTSKFFGCGWMNANRIQQYVDSQARSENKIYNNTL